MSSTSVRAFPPQWKKGDHWKVCMTTESPGPPDFGPQYAERTFLFEVAVPPDAHKGYAAPSASPSSA